MRACILFVSTVVCAAMYYFPSYLLVVPIVSCIVSLVLIVCVKYSKRLEHRELSNLIWKLERTTLGSGAKQTTIVEVAVLSVVYFFYLLINPIGNLFRMVFKKRSGKYDNWTDGMVLALSVAAIGFYSCPWSDSLRHCWLLASFYVWIVLNIAFHKLKEVCDIAGRSSDGGVLSVRRTVFLSFLNIVQLLFCYAFLYRYLGIIEKDAVLYAFRVFATQGIADEMIISCTWQKALIISQLSVLVVVLMVFVGNMFQLKEEKHASAKSRKKVLRKHQR